MINNDNQRNTENNLHVRYKNDYVGYEAENNDFKNEYSYDEDVRVRERAPISNAGFDRLIDEQVSTVDNNSANKESDLLPSPTTLQFIGRERNYVYQDLNNRQKLDENDETSYRINTKSKVMIAVYALVVLTIFTLIILNTRLLKTMDTSISEQEARIEALQAENTNLYSQYEVLSSDEEIIRRAEEMGMIKGE